MLRLPHTGEPKIHARHDKATTILYPMALGSLGRASFIARLSSHSTDSRLSLGVLPRLNGRSSRAQPIVPPSGRDPSAPESPPARRSVREQAQRAPELTRTRTRALPNRRFVDREIDSNRCSITERTPQNRLFWAIFGKISFCAARMRTQGRSAPVSMTGYRVRRQIMGFAKGWVDRLFYAARLFRSLCKAPV